MIEVLYLVLALIFGILAITFFIMAWKVCTCPDKLWREMQQTPYHKSYDVWERFWR